MSDELTMRLILMLAVALVACPEPKPEPAPAPEKDQAAELPEGWPYPPDGGSMGFERP